MSARLEQEAVGSARVCEPTLFCQRPHLRASGPARSLFRRPNKRPLFCRCSVATSVDTRHAARLAVLQLVTWDRFQLVLENLALRHQRAVHKRWVGRPPIAVIMLIRRLSAENVTSRALRFGCPSSGLWLPEPCKLPEERKERLSVASGRSTGPQAGLLKQTSGRRQVWRLQVATTVGQLNWRPPCTYPF